jgi:membrane-bound lytic murein transglycosylase A
VTTGGRLALALMAFALLSSCSWLIARPPGIGAEVAWDRLPGWGSDRLTEAWPALLGSCRRLGTRDPAWRAICEEAKWMDVPDEASAQAFFERNFRAHEMLGEDGRRDGLITGYYEPLLHGSTVRTDRYRYPLYRKPENLVTVDLGALYPELKGKTVRGRLEGNRVVPYYSRAEITGNTIPLQGQELLWVDDAVSLFMLQVQGSGRIRLEDGSELAVGYSDQNGHPYVPIGRRLVEMQALKVEDVTLSSIRAWLSDHPDEAEALLNSNPSYIFFILRDSALAGPLGSLNVPLTPQRSIAVDASRIALGLPVWLDTTLPGSEPAWRRLMLAQDTGGAIKGQVRADVFFGRGAEAERYAGEMKQSGRMYVLLPREPEKAPAENRTAARWFLP